MTRADFLKLLENEVRVSHENFPFKSSIELKEIIDNECLIYNEYNSEKDILYSLYQGSSPMFPIMKFYITTNAKSNNPIINLYRISMEDLSVINEDNNPINKEDYEYLIDILKRKPDYTIYSDLGKFHPKTNLQALKAQYNFQVADEWPGLKHLPLE